MYYSYHHNTNSTTVLYRVFCELFPELVQLQEERRQQQVSELYCSSVDTDLYCVL